MKINITWITEVPPVKNVIFTWCFSIMFLFSASQDIEVDWSHADVSPKRFIENKGQFDGRNFNGSEQTLFAVDQGAFQIYFSKNGLTYCIEKKEKNRNRKEGSHEPKVKYYRTIVQTQWVGANKNTKIIPINKCNDYYSYSFYDDGRVVNINHIPGYKKIVYKELYPNIDVEYVFHPKEGIKYALILHPGADPSQIRIQYKTPHANIKDGDIAIQLNQLGQIEINTALGNIIEHKPMSFYSSSKTGINSSYVFENKVLTFELDNYDKTQEVIIDPWIVSPTFNSSTAVWEVETDGAGNVYVIGGETPMDLKKYNSAGILQWTYSTPWDTATVWLGTLATDAAGTSYITSGTAPEMERIDNAGNMIWHSNGGGGTMGISDEMWSITFNCDNTKLIVGGTKGPPLFGFDYYAAIYDIDMSNGNVLNTVTVAYTDISVFGATPEEVRSISSSRNAKYIFLTHDQVGAINQILGVCPTDDPVFQVDNTHNLGYKCENYLPPGQNGGGLKALVANDNYFYTHAGDEIHRWSLNNGTLLNSVALPGGNATTGFGGRVVDNSGLAVDDCGNVYAGSMNNVVKFDSALNILSQSSVLFTVYDVSVNSNGEVLAVGAQSNNSVTNRNGRIESINMSACAQYALVCCDASICPVGPFCDTDPAINLTTTSPSGTWSGPGITNTTTGTFDPSVAGQGTHIIVNTIGCGSDSIIIVVNTCAILTVCLEFNGDLTVSSGTAPYTWQSQTTTQDCSLCFPPGNCGFPPGCDFPVTTWTTYSTSATATPPGTFPIQVIDNSSNTLQIDSLGGIPFCSSPCTLTVTSSVTNALCNGGCDGTATANPSGGTSPYTYQWDSNAGNQTSQTATVLCAGSYFVTVTDNAGCADTISVTVNQPAPLTISAISTPIMCNGGSDGTATATPSGGASPYNYAWSDGQLTALATGLAAGTYIITVTDNNNCIADTTVVVTEPTILALSTSSVDENCGAADGSATLTTNGGTPSYTYSWSNGQTTSTATALAAGSYTVTVTDNNNCVDSIAVNVNSSGGPTLTISGSNVTCNGGNDGSATVTATGGILPYTYLWNDLLNQTNASAVGLIAGLYNISVTDSNGCTTIDTITITEPIAILLSTISTPAACGMNDGTAVVTTAGGGNGPFTYLWSPGGDTTNFATGLAAGTYFVTVSDANGCTATDSVIVASSGGPSATIISTTDVSCFGATDGSAVVSTTGGTGPYTYSWSPSGGISDTANGLGSGNYTVTVQDAGGCITSDSTTINSPAELLIAISASSMISCFGYNDGSAATIAVGGTGAYSYFWSPNSDTTSSISNLAPGTYYVLISDANNCSKQDSVTITEPPALVLTLSFDSASCGVSDGAAYVTVGGGTAAYTYQWAPIGGTNDSALGLPVGVYSVTVVDANGCTIVDSVAVNNSGGATAFISSVTNITCTDTVGSASVSVTGGMLPYTYLWSDSLSQTNSTATGLLAGNYNCTVTDAANCMFIVTATITEPTPIVVTISNDTIICGIQNVTITALATGGNPPFTYIWDQGLGLGSSQVVSPLSTTTYTVIVLDADTCSSQSQSVTITTSTPLVASAAGQDTICNGGSVPLTVFASGGNNVYTYLWDDPLAQTNSLIFVSPDSTTTYNVIVTDGCGSTPATASITITVIPELQINPPTATICPGDTAILTASGADNYWWKDINTLDTLDTGAVFSVSPSVTTSYIITAQDDSTCSTTDTVTVYVTQALTADFSFLPEVATIFDPTFNFIDLSFPAANLWQWNFGDNATDSIQNPSHTYTYGDTGTYPVQLIVWDATGCSDTIIKFVTVKGVYSLYAPNSFTPNGDGNNDYFLPKGLGIEGKYFEMLIFNRWGDLIYETSGSYGDYETMAPIIGWNGTANYGNKLAQEDVYVWLVKTVEDNEKKHQYIGHVTLIR